MLTPFAEIKLTACPSNLHADGCAANAHPHHATVCADCLVVDHLQRICWATANGHKQWDGLLLNLNGIAMCQTERSVFFQ